MKVLLMYVEDQPKQQHNILLKNFAGISGTTHCSTRENNVSSLGAGALVGRCEPLCFFSMFEKSLLEQPGYSREQMCKQTLKSSGALIGVGHEIFTNRCAWPGSQPSARTPCIFVSFHKAPPLPHTREEKH